MKTRLAKDLGDGEAAKIYGELAAKNLESLLTLRESGISIAILYDPPEAGEKVRAWLVHDFVYLPQRGQDLGERLRNAFEGAFREGAERVLAMGSDTLGLGPKIVEEAYKRLRDSELVLGPARDGGYYLMGLSHPQPRLFHGIPWSTRQVLESTLSRARKLGLSTYLLPELEDLDGIENMEEFKRWFQENKTDATSKMAR